MSGSVTPNFRLQKPPFDVIPWDQAINGNMDTIDAALGQCLPIANFMGTWKNATSYSVAQVVVDGADNTMWQCALAHISASAPTTFYQDRTAHPFNWTATTNSIGGSVAITVSDVAPSSAKQGDLWFDTASAQLFVYYNDGTSIQWVVSINQPGNLADAPNDGNLYGRQSTAWTVIGGGIASVGRNLLHNSMFNVAQRGQGPFTTQGYTADRWFLGLTGATATCRVIGLSDANRTSIGDESAIRCLTNAVGGTAGAGDYYQLGQPIENILRLSGKTVTVSFYANSDVANYKIGVSIDQIFGTGGTPSASVFGNGQSVSLSPVSGQFGRFSLTFNVPSAVGKALGSNADDRTTVNIWLSAGAGAALRAGNIGVQSGTVNLWGVQLEVGSVATPLEKPDPQQDLAKCQRFYQNGSAMIAGYNSAGAGMSYLYPFPVQMRTTPTVVLSAPSTINTSNPTAPATSASGFQFQAIVTAQASAFAAANWTASADL